MILGMIGAVVRVMWLGLVRDRGALAMAFVLPPVIFVVFAAIIAGAGSEPPAPRVLVLDRSGAPSGARLVAALRAEGGVRILPETPADEGALRSAIRAGAADAGLLIRADLARPGAGAGAPPVAVLSDAGKAVAATVLAGKVEAALARRLPEIALGRTAPAVERLVGGFSPAQTQALGAGLAALGASDAPAASSADGIARVEPLAPGRAAGSMTYYAGAVAILFLLFSAMQGAATLIDERQSGITERLTVGPGGTDVLVIGKFAFLVLQGLLQVGLIFLVAWAAYGVDVPGAFGLWSVTTLLAAATAAALAVAVASACSTRQQAQTVSTFAVLILSAVGGSMVPRFMMPGWLQDLGWLTPNAWAIEAYLDALWRDASLAEIAPPWAALAGATALGLAAALTLARRSARG